MEDQPNMAVGVGGGVALITICLISFHPLIIKQLSVQFKMILAQVKYVFLFVTNDIIKFCLFAKLTAFKHNIFW